MKTIIFHKYAITAVRIIFGLIFLSSGLSYLLHISPLPKGTPQSDIFVGALIGSGYEFTLVKIIEVAAGLLIVANFFVPLTLVVIFPITVNIILFNVMLWSEGLPVGIALFVFNVYLFFAYLEHYKPLLQAKVRIA